MATEMSTKNSESDGHRQSTAVKSPAPDAATSSQPKDSPAAAASPKARRSGKRSSAGGTSDTLTEAASRSTADQSTHVATEPPQHTKLSDAASISQSDQPSRTGGPPDLTVTSAVARDLAQMAARDPLLARSSLAMAALALAREMDDPDNSATSKSMCARALLDTMDRLAELCPPLRKGNAVDLLTAQREERLARESAAET